MRNASVVVLVLACASPLYAQVSPRVQEWRSPPRRSGNEWLGSSRSGTVGVSSDPRISPGAQARFSAHAVALKKNVPIVDSKAWATGIQSGISVEIGGKTLFSRRGDTGLNISWSYPAPLFDFSTTFFLWVIPVTVGATGGANVEARLSVPDLKSLKKGDEPSPVHLSASLRGWAYATLYAGVGFSKWGFKCFVGVEGTARFLDTTLGVDLVSAPRESRGLAYLDSNPLSGEIAAVARMERKIWRWKVRKGWSWSLAKFDGRSSRDVLVNF